jgi:hypothetical protein
VALVGVAATLAVVVSSDDEPEAVVVAPGLGQMGGGMMGDGATGVSVGPVTSMGEAASRVHDWLEQSGFNGLRTGEVMAFSNGYYAAVETPEGSGAFELLLGPTTGWLSPEPGPNMMWNTEYGMMQGRYGGGTTGGGMMGGGMMGGGSTGGGMMGRWVKYGSRRRLRCAGARDRRRLAGRSAPW